MAIDCRVALTVFRRPLSDLFSTLGQRVRKFSFGGLSLELAEASEMKPPQALDTELRQLEAGLYPQSGVPDLTSLLSHLQSGGQNDYIVIDLGSEASPRWLTSRLYLLALLITLIDRSLCLVFVESAKDSWDLLRRIECAGRWHAGIAGWNRRARPLMRSSVASNSLRQAYRR